MQVYKRGTDRKWKEMVSEQDALKQKAEELERDLRTQNQTVNDLREVCLIFYF